MDTQKYLNNLKKSLFAKKHKITFDSKFKELSPNQAGVYAVWQGKDLIYVGESGNVFKRINRDLKDTRNHSLRKYIGRDLFGQLRNFQDASSSKKFPENIEKKVNAYLESCKISFIPVELGRTELEEYIVNTMKPKYNVKIKRK